MANAPKPLSVYKKAMEMAQATGDHHSYNELQAAYEEAEEE
jgi:hypothetical protein